MLVSICIPVKNGEDYIEECLTSVLSQTYKNIEIVVYNNCSTDRTVECVELIREYSPLPIYLYHQSYPQNMGRNWNDAVGAAKGEYIKLLCHDDKLEPTCIESQVQQLSKSSERSGFAYSERYIIDGEGEVLEDAWSRKYGDLQRDLPYLKTPNVEIGSEVFSLRNYFRINNRFGEPAAVLIKKEVFLKAGMFNEALNQSIDFEFFNRVLGQFTAIYVPGKMACFRRTPSQQTMVNSEVQSITKLRARAQLLKLFMGSKSFRHYPIRVKLKFFLEFIFTLVLQPMVYFKTTLRAAR